MVTKKAAQPKLKEQYPVTAHAQTFIFGKDVVKSKDARKVGQPYKIRLHRAWPTSVQH